MSGPRIIYSVSVTKNGITHMTNVILQDVVWSGTANAEIFFGITFFGSLVTAPVMMQYTKPGTAGNRLRSNTIL
jgi:hypothetical protein